MNKTRTLPGALVVVAMLAACASENPRIAATAEFSPYEVTKASEPTRLGGFTVARCNALAANCAIAVNPLAGCSKDPSKVELTPDLAQVPRERKGHPLPMVWYLPPHSDWAFSGSGIRFYASGTEFVDKGSQGGNWVVIDQTGTGGGWNYEVNVVNTRTQEVCRRDPTVVNDW